MNMRWKRDSISDELDRVSMEVIMLESEETRIDKQLANVEALKVRKDEIIKKRTVLVERCDELKAEKNKRYLASIPLHFEDKQQNNTYLGLLRTRDHHKRNVAILQAMIDCKAQATKEDTCPEYYGEGNEPTILNQPMSYYQQEKARFEIELVDSEREIAAMDSLKEQKHSAIFRK